LELVKEIVPDLTFAATINAVLIAGTTPVIVDIDKDSWTICPNEIEKAITSNTKAIIPVHVYGQACEMNRIMDIAKKHKLKVIEDCAEAHGAEFQNQKVGSFGDISTFSFFANKIITTGEGGMCTTNSDNLNQKMRQL
jgi:perosamine synthetase